MAYVDTVVVGAGSAGAVIAARATENAGAEVLLLEAGPDYPGEIPGDLADGRQNSIHAHDWQLRHLPLKGQKVFPFPRGRVVGGSSAVNTCIALRGQPYDYDEWASLGLPEWSFDKCLPAFKRIETDYDFDNEWHGKSGPIPVRRHPAGELVPWQAAFLNGCAELGFERCPDHNQPGTLGYGPHVMNKIDGRRQSAAACYLTPEVRKRPNLEVRAGSEVRRVLFENRKVVGVELERRGAVERIQTSQVVLCAGAVMSPAVLLRSGVGPRSELARLGIAPVADVPGVGRRLLDHPGAVVVFAPRPGVSSVDHPLIQTTLRFTSAGSQFPGDMQLQPGSFVPFPSVSVPLVTLMICVGKPRGAGVLRFDSAAMSAKPRIESRLLEEPEDLDKAVEAIELAWMVASSSAMGGLASFLWPPERTLRRRRTLREWLPVATGSGYHPCGTIPMGVDSDPYACVDQHGRVRGVSGLFVADASIMPTIPSSNTNFPTLMIGERFGEWLRDGVLAS